MPKSNKKKRPTKPPMSTTIYVSKPTSGIKGHVKFDSLQAEACVSQKAKRKNKCC